MEIVVALSIIFSVMALFTTIYALEKLMKLQERTNLILDLAQRVLNNNDKIIKYIDALEGRIKKE